VRDKIPFQQKTTMEATESAESCFKNPWEKEKTFNSPCTILGEV